ncbi:MAG: biotin transporter BioY [Chloroflexota bacterium]
MQGTPSRATTIAGALIPKSTTWVNVAVDAALIVGFAALTGLAAQVAVYLNPAVPITGQTFMVLLAGAALGWKKGGASMLVYLVAGGLLGLPVFAPSGPWPGSSLGYLPGFAAAAVIVGYLCERGWGKNPFKLIAAMLLGEVTIYAFGLSWLAFYFSPDELASSVSAGYLGSPTRLAVVWEWGVKDFIIGDTIKMLMAAFGVPLAWVGIRKLKGEDV